MMTLGGQTFAKAYAALEQGLGCATSFNACGAGLPSTKTAARAYANGFAPQPFFETALANTGYCTGFASCTAAVVYNEGFRTGNLVTQSVWSMWSDLDRVVSRRSSLQRCCGLLEPNGTTVSQNQQTTLPGFNFARSMLNSPIVGGPLNCGTPIGTATCGGSGQMTSGVGLNASIGHGNYNAGFASLKVTNWHGLTFQENFTYSKALGTAHLCKQPANIQPTTPSTSTRCTECKTSIASSSLTLTCFMNHRSIGASKVSSDVSLAAGPSRQFSRPAAALRCIATPIPTPSLTVRRM